jgi:uncharacterized DUF497 family protein
MHMDIEWDADKAVANFKKHHVRFEDQAAGAAPVDEATLRRVLREELKAG